MTKIFNFAKKSRSVVGRVAHAKSSDPATPPQNLERAPARSSSGGHFVKILCRIERAKIKNWLLF